MDYVTPEYLDHHMNELSDVISRAFSSIEGRLVSINSRLNNIDNRLDTLADHENRIRQIEDATLS